MDWVKTSVLSGSSFSLKTLAMHGYMTCEVSNPNAEVYKPVSKVSIILPAYNEEFFIETALKSLRNQNIYLAYPHLFELIVVDSESTDRTVEIAKQYTNLVISGPRGKLTCRHIGISEASGTIIVAVDADTFYPVNWLNLILRHFHNPQIVGVGGPRTSNNLLINIAYVYRALPDALAKRMTGSNSAFLKNVYLDSGGFHDIDQLDRGKMVMEEEFEFSKRLQQYGQVVYDLQTTVNTSIRHIFCRFGGPRSPEEIEYCQAIEEKQRF